MGGSSKASTSTANNQQTTNTQQINTATTSSEVSGDNSIGATGGRDVTVTNITTDQGAINAAKDIAYNSLGTAENVAQAGLDTGRQIGQSSLDFAGEFGDRALALAQSSTSEGLHSALDYGTGVTAGAFDLIGSALKGAFASEADTSTTLGKAITDAANASRTDSSQNIDNLIKYGSIAAAVVVLGVAAVFIFRK